MRVAIVHPWFLERGGAERVVEALAALYPQADLFCLAADPSAVPVALRGRKLYTSPIDRLLRGKLRYKRAHFMALFPWAVESLDVSSYDLVISSCGPAVMGIKKRPSALHIAYVHTPQRAWWDLYAERQASMSGMGRYAFVASALKIRNWELNAMQRVDCVVSNSHYVAQRVRKYFKRESSVIYPPVRTDIGYISDAKKEYYLVVSRLDIDKRIDLAIEACNRLQRRLIVVGTGRAEPHLKRLAGPTIEFRGYVSDDTLPALYADCRALIFPADEDFGIVPVEAQAFGRPVIAYGHGGALETVRAGSKDGTNSGVFFACQTTQSLTEALLQFEEIGRSFTPSLIRSRCLRFSESAFSCSFAEIVSSSISGRRDDLSVN